MTGLTIYRFKMDLQDKKAWCGVGADSEDYFLENIAEKHGFHLMPHPGKSEDKYETDFQLKNGAVDVDLKHIATPFFKAGLYGRDPNYTVTLNHKDYLRYSYKYPVYRGVDMVILFWVTIKECEKFNIRVSDIMGVWSLRLTTLDDWIRNRLIPSHSYIERKSECGSNAKHSWLIDLRQCRQHKMINQEDSV